MNGLWKISKFFFLLLITIAVASGLDTEENVSSDVSKSDVKCGKLSNNTISTPNFPNNYDNDAECLWEIRADIGYRIEIKFDSRFAIEPSLNCSKDYVEFLELENDEWVSKKRICGRDTSFLYFSITNKLNVVFKSDSSNTDTGFQARWEEICSGAYKASNEVEMLSSPGFPNTPPNVDCLYIITFDEDDAKLKLNFTTFIPETAVGDVCNFENMTVEPYQEHLVYNEEMVTYCGSESPGVKFLKDGAIIRFRTHEMFHKMAFQFTFNVEDDKEDEIK